MDPTGSPRGNITDPAAVPPVSVYRTAKPSREARPVPPEEDRQVRTREVTSSTAVTRREALHRYRATAAAEPAKTVLSPGTSSSPARVDRRRTAADPGVAPRNQTGMAVPVQIESSHGTRPETLGRLTELVSHEMAPLADHIGRQPAARLRVDLSQNGDEDLHVVVRLRLAGNHGVDGHLRASDPELAALVDNSLEGLRESLRGAGFQRVEIGVDSLPLEAEADTGFSWTGATSQPHDWGASHGHTPGPPRNEPLSQAQSGPTDRTTVLGTSGEGRLLNLLA